MGPKTAQQIMDGELTIKSKLSRDPDKSRKTGVKCTTFNIPMSCSKCGKAFTTKSKLNYHERIHTNERPFSCSKCDYKCTTSGSLKTHERIHINEKPFRCSKCDKAFATFMGHLKVMKECILMRNHSAAQSVRGNSPKQVS